MRAGALARGNRSCVLFSISRASAHGIASLAFSGALRCSLSLVQRDGARPRSSRVRVRHRVNTTASHTSRHTMSAAVTVSIKRTSRVGKRKAAIFVETSLYHPRAHENARGAREGCAAEVTRRASRARSASSRARRARGLARARTTDAVCGRRYIGIFEALFFVAVKNYKRTPRRFVRLR